MIVYACLMLAFITLKTIRFLYPSSNLPQYTSIWALPAVSYCQQNSDTLWQDISEHPHDSDSNNTAAAAFESHIDNDNSQLLNESENSKLNRGLSLFKMSSTILDS